MKTTLYQLSMAVAFLERANTDRDVSIKDALIRAASGPGMDFGVGLNKKLPLGKPVSEPGVSPDVPGKPTAAEILNSSFLRESILAWAKQEQAAKEAMANSNVGFFDDIAEGLKAIFSGPVERVNSHLEEEDKVRTAKEQEKAEKNKREEEEKKKKQ